MFHLQELELLHWDYCQRITLPLDAGIVTIAGPNGSGKTTLLDALRTLLGLDCSGGRTYKTYARHAQAESSWLRAVVDNRPRGRQNSSRPFASSLLYADRVTLACRIERHGGDWQRRYCVVDGEQTIEVLAETSDWLGIEAWRKRLEGAGLTRAIGRVLALEQGQTDRLCELSPRELLRLVFEVFGDQEVLDRYEQAKSHQQQLQRELDQGEQELSYARAQLQELAVRVQRYQDWRARIQERERLATEVLPVLQWDEARHAAALEGRRIHSQRLACSAETRAQADGQRRLLKAFAEKEQARQQQIALEDQRKMAQDMLAAARETEKPVADLLTHERELQGLAAVEQDGAALQQRVQALADQERSLGVAVQAARQAQAQAEQALEQLSTQSLPPAPEEVRRFRQLLRTQGIDHHCVADAIDIAEERWRSAAEGYLRGLRWVVVLQQAGDEQAAFELAERERYRHYLVADAAQPEGRAPAQSLLAALRVTAGLPRWLLRSLAELRCVADVAEGRRMGADWITPEAYHRDARGGRSLFVAPREHQFGLAAVQARRQHLEAEKQRAESQFLSDSQALAEVQRQLKDARAAVQGQRAAEELLNRAAEFADARERLPALTSLRVAAGLRWATLDTQHTTAVTSARDAENRYSQLQREIDHAADQLRERERQLQERSRAQGREIARLREQAQRLPPSWRALQRRAALRGEFDNAKQAEIRLHRVEQELLADHWEKDALVEDRHAQMRHQVDEHETALTERRASNEAARIAASNAREKYIEVLRSTLRRYGRNVQQLGELAGVAVQTRPPHLDNEDSVLAQAGLEVRFSFDGKGEVGLNDGEASGGQQVLKSLILLVGLMKDEDMPGGFVFIDEPFAHLDVRNIQLVGHFLKSTRAQYLLTTPITHNVEVFEPSDITLVTHKKRKGERWAPAITLAQRRVRS